MEYPASEVNDGGCPGKLVRLNVTRHRQFGLKKERLLLIGPLSNREARLLLSVINNAKVIAPGKGAADTGKTHEAAPT